MDSKKLHGYPESVQSLFICKRELVGVGEGEGCATATNTNNLQSNINMVKIVSQIIHSGALSLSLQIRFLGVDQSPDSCPIFRFQANIRCSLRGELFISHCC